MGLAAGGSDFDAYMECIHWAGARLAGVSQYFGAHWYSKSCCRSTDTNRHFNFNFDAQCNDYIVAIATPVVSLSKHVSAVIPIALSVFPIFVFLL